MLVRQILGMKGGTDVVTIGSDATVTDAAKLLSEKRIGALVATDGSGAPQGILSERDIVRELGRRGEGCLKDKVETLMTRDMISTSPDETTDQVLEKMTAGRFRHMPVMEGGTMTGLISIGEEARGTAAEIDMMDDGCAETDQAAIMEDRREDEKGHAPRRLRRHPQNGEHRGRSGQGQACRSPTAASRRADSP